ncbi:NAD-dependent epimerase/dehydratase family protein [Azohydromonas caseinilytica]|uniref:NAD(P)-dependent oxidoreductase n=1 Tax=Azohydromonas caseinilytica TaxID=2728836 RepID=A0A848FGX9_9BURK|nr:NAD(P)-dependent oxidoreductase [Azohydromonas caseinilytica]NML17513.1 NAD(P)-dependent oxidoreductase [Azohydromonas caseinilytica]
MRILLTGANGFLGGYCAARLREVGHQVTTTDLAGPMDLRGDLADAHFTRQLPVVDAVVHAAAVQYVSPNLPLLGRVGWFRRNNIEATQRLVDRYRDEDTHFVNIGTSMMYAQNGAPQYGTDSLMQGQGVYSHSKLAAQGFVEQGMARWATVIPCIIGGPGREGLFRNFVRAIARGRPVLVPGRADHPVAMVHVEDVARLVDTVVRQRARGFYNAAAPRPLSINDWVREIQQEISAPPARIVHLPLKPLQWLAALSGWRLLAREQVLMLTWPHVLDIDRSLALGWQPRHDNALIARHIARHIYGSEFQPVRAGARH